MLSKMRFYDKYSYLDKPIKKKPYIPKCPYCGILLFQIQEEYWECKQCNTTFRIDKFI